MYSNMFDRLAGRWYYAASTRDKYRVRDDGSIYCVDHYTHDWIRVERLPEDAAPCKTPSVESLMDA